MTDKQHSLFYMTMSLRYLDNQLQQLGKYSYSRDRALSVLGLTDWDFQDPEARIDAHRVENMYRDAAAVLNNQYIGLQAGNDFRVANFGKTGAIYTNSKNLAQVFEMNRRYQKISVDVGLSEHVVENGRNFFVFNTYPEAHELYQLLGMIFGAQATAFRWLSWATGFGLKSVTLTRPTPKDASPYTEAVNCPVIFNSARNGVELHPETMDATLHTHNPEKLANMVAMLDRVLENKESTDSFQSAVLASIRAALSNGRISLGIIAKRLDMPERKLRRILSEQGFSYRELLNMERKTLFKELHAHGASFSDIAHSLAYNDQAAFTRAFRGWYGITPGEYKAED